MKTGTIIAAFIFISLISGCAGSPVSIAMKAENDGDLTNENTFALCRTWSAFKNQPNAKLHMIKILRELERRNAILSGEYSMIYGNMTKIGMSAVAFSCIHGLPSKVNTTVTSGATNEQWVYRREGQIEAKYAYFRNGKLTSIQY